MYRLARNRTGLVTNRPWDWYLTNAWQTGIAMTTHAPHYAQFGQMEALDASKTPADFESAYARLLGAFAQFGNVDLGLTVSPDGRTILYSRVDSTVDDLMLVENFR